MRRGPRRATNRDRDAECEHRQRGPRECKHERRRGDDAERPGPGAEAGDFAVGRRHTACEAAAKDACDEADRDRDRDRPRCCEPLRERDAADGIVCEHDQVREVRARQQERGRVRHEDRAVEKGVVAEAAAARRMEQDGRHEDDGRIEIQHGRDRGLDREQSREQRDGPAGRARDCRACGFEEILPRRRRADQQQPGDEREGRPGLRERGVRAGRGQGASRRTPARRRTTRAARS